MGAAVLSIPGTVALAACGDKQVVTREVPVERVVVKEVEVDRVVTRRVEKVVTHEVEKILRHEVAVEKVVENVVTKEVETTVEDDAMPQRPPAVLRLANDHTSGARGATMIWALKTFHQQFPHIAIKFEPPNYLYAETFSTLIEAGDQPELALLDGGFLNTWVHRGGFARIDGALNKHPDWEPTKWYAPPDEMSVGQFDDDRAARPAPHSRGYEGVMFGLPYQGNINGAVYNFTLLEDKGVPMPVAGSFHLEREAQDMFAQTTDPETGTYGLRMHPNAWLIWGSWARAMQDTGNHMYRAPDQLHWDIFNDGGDRGFELAVDTIRSGVAMPLDQIASVAGDAGSPFAAGKQARHWTAGGLGNSIRHIEDQFAWGLGPVEEGDRGPFPHHFTNQGHYCTAAAERNGLVEECTETLLFFAGPKVQGRIAIDRGSLPMLKSVIHTDAFKAGPPENHGYYKTWMDKTDHHHWQTGHPNWWEWYESFRAAAPLFSGEMSIEAGMKRIIDTSDRVLADSRRAYDSWKSWIEALPPPSYPLDARPPRG